MKTLWHLALFPIGLALALLWVGGLFMACYVDTITPRYEGEAYR